MDDEVVIQAERAPAPAAVAPGRTLWGRPLHIVILVAILVAALLAESVLVFRGNGAEREQNDVLDVSRRFVALLTTYNATTIERQRAQVLALATGKFRDQYDQLTGASFVTTLKERQADSKGALVRIAVADVEGDNATILAVVRVTTTNKDLKQPRVDTNLLEVALVKTSSGWRIDNVTILGTLG